MFVLLDAALFREEGNPQRFSYQADHPLAEELEEQMTILIREYVGEASTSRRTRTRTGRMPTTTRR